MYNPRAHAAFTERLGNMMRELRQLQIEGVALKEIYVAQALSGESEEFTDAGTATVDELRQAMSVANSYVDWLTGNNQTPQQDRRPVTTAFLQSP
tara:strand:+ start:13543 stop:13827 length:285 start_codon:yes stop_codon:yes gene_type:complete